jgi:hypothetical protein
METVGYWVVCNTNKLKGRVTLKPAEDSYLMNHLGLGNNATLVAMVTRIQKSKLEVDNYIEYE